MLIVGGSQANAAENKIFEAYIIEFSDHIDPARNTDISCNTHPKLTCLCHVLNTFHSVFCFLASLDSVNYY